MKGSRILHFVELGQQHQQRKRNQGKDAHTLFNGNVFERNVISFD